MNTYLVGVENEGKECWWKCRRKEGPCSWCGDEGMCCRQGWTGNGCDGNVGGRHNHQCSKAPEGKLISYYYFDWLFKYVDTRYNNFTQTRAHAMKS